MTAKMPWRGQHPPANGVDASDVPPICMIDGSRQSHICPTPRTSPTIFTGDPAVMTAKMPWRGQHRPANGLDAGRGQPVCMFDGSRESRICRTRRASPTIFTGQLAGMPAKMP